MLMDLPSLKAKYQKHQQSHYEKSIIISDDNSIKSPIKNETFRVLSPSIARDYVKNLKSFISNYESPKPSVMKDNVSIASSQLKTTNKQQALLFWDNSQRLNQYVQQVGNQKIEVRKQNQNGSLKSIRYYYLTTPILGHINDLEIGRQCTIMGLKNSGKKKLLYQILDQMKQPCQLKIKNQLKEETHLIQGDYRNYIKRLLQTQKKDNLILQIDSQGFQITVCGIQKALGQIIVSIQPNKQNVDLCKKTLKFIELI